MGRTISVTPTSIAGTGNVIQLDDGSLILSGLGGGVATIKKSIDGGSNWTTEYTYSNTEFDPLLAFLDSNNNIYFGTIHSTESGVLVRSTDNGDNWGVVATSEGSGWWNMCEDSVGNLYASEYSRGEGDADELYAYNVWKSVDGGVTWAKFHTAQKQSTPGARDGIRHIHIIACDDQDNLFVSYGDPPFVGSGTTYHLNNDGTLGKLISIEGNGWTSHVSLGGGISLFGGDATPYSIYRYDANTNRYTTVLNVLTEFGNEYNEYVTHMIKGADGVIYALLNGGGETQKPAIVASADDGITWVLIEYLAGSYLGSRVLTRNTEINGANIYYGRAAYDNSGYIPDYTRAELRSLYTSTLTIKTS